MRQHGPWLQLSVHADTVTAHAVSAKHEAPKAALQSLTT